MQPHVAPDSPASEEPASTTPDPEGTATPPPFRFDIEDLGSLASAGVIRRGVGYFREDRVMALDWTEDGLWATVEGSLKEPYGVEIGYDEEGELVFDCTCPFDGEPVCKHAVAALVASTAHRSASEQELLGAEERARQERFDSAVTQVRVRHVGGDRWFGTWEARSTGLYGQAAKVWTVQIRALVEPLNHCDCPDFANNRLGTCKHIEAVLHHLRKRAPKKFERLARRGPPMPVIAVDWTGDDGPEVVLRRTDSASGELRVLLERHFEPDGRFAGRLPEGLFSLGHELGGRTDVLLGNDVLSLARRHAEDDVHALRAERVKREIRSAGDRLPGVHARLYPYQVDGVAFLAASGRALLADDMGLGKTLQAIAAVKWLSSHEGVRRTLVVCPASLKAQWAREIERFTGDDTLVIGGPAAQRGVQWRSRSPWTIVNYELLLRDRTVIQTDLAPDLLILDEAQRIKNWRTKSAAAVKQLQTRYAFVLTGTPLENRLEDLYSLMQVIDPRLLGPLWRFLAAFHVVDPRGAVLGFRNLGALRKRLTPVMLRRDRSLVRDQLPDRIQLQLDVPLTDRQRELHDEAASNAARLASIMKRRPLTPQEHNRLMAALQTARMACDAAGLVDKETTGSPKLTELGRLLEELCVDGARKVVVFSEWERMTAMAEGVARELGLGTVRLHGGVPSARRGALIDRFREDPSVQVFLSTDAGGVGLNLQAATALINLDLPWNPAKLEQRIARIHRLGQREPVQVVLLVAQDSYEQRVETLIQGKQDLFDNVVDPEATGEAVTLGAGVVKKLMSALLDEEADGAEAADAPTGQEEVTAQPAEIGQADGEEVTAQPAETGQADGPSEPQGTEPPTVALQQEVAGEPADPPHQEPAPTILPGGADRHGPRRSDLERRLRAADHLLEGGFGPEALDLAADAMVAALAGRLGRRPPGLDAAPVWLFAELVPQGAITVEQAAMVARCLALVRTPSIPAGLCQQVLADARMMVGQLEPAGP